MLRLILKFSDEEESSLRAALKRLGYESLEEMAKEALKRFDVPNPTASRPRNAVKDRKLGKREGSSDEGRLRK